MSKFSGDEWICDVQASIECMGGSGGDNGAQAAADSEAKRQAQIQQGMDNINNTFGQFDDNFFNDRAQAYRDYAQPQLDDQWAQAQKGLTYALDRSGLTNSSVAGDMLAKATQAHDLAQQQLEDTALNYANDARSAVENNREQLVNELQSTADPSAAAQGAAASARALTAMPAFSPLGNLFQNVTGGLAQAANVNPNGLGGALVNNGYGGMLFQTSPTIATGGGTGSSRVVSSG